jgi:hypothetical protein
VGLAFKVTGERGAIEEPNTLVQGNVSEPAKLEQIAIKNWMCQLIVQVARKQC